ncbi:MAG: phosphatase PAP2 family protein [Armatimonadetes bacterium]|nr:phosphatase PAP2 family protein [Armatimonadota bacterium]
MPPLWQVDADVFRAVHLGMHRDWLDPLLVTVTFSGLGYLQAIPLLSRLFAHRAKAVMVVAFLCTTVLAFAVERHVLAAVAAAALFGLFSGLDRAVAGRALVSLAVAGLLRLGIVQFLPRARPSNLEFSMPLEDLHGSTSFPSGHATTSFAVAAVVCWCYGKGAKGTWAAWILVWAVLVGLSRVYVGVHFPSDVIAAALLGLASGSLVFWFWPVAETGPKPEAEES